jgi:hypothetical protein
VLQTTNYAVYLGVGRPSRQVIVLAVQLAVLIPAMVYLSSVYGVTGAAYAVGLASACSFPVTLGFALRETRARLLDFATSIWRPAVGTIAMFAVLQAVPRHDIAGATPQLLTQLLETVALGAGIYVAVVLLCWALAGRPDATETTVLRQAAAVLERSLRAMRAAFSQGSAK